MNDYTTIGFFDNSFDSELAIIKGMLEEAGIKFYIKNENMRSIEPLSNNMDFAIAMELCVETNRLKEAKEIYQNIKKT